ncbi:DUF2793 domain-containing protein [Brucella anthropi]|uniref:phage tail-collar fiber domain-containing protein n=1 Tax=Brucella anthropi TaxID=529 RepID=UPI00124C2746|nr:phage tail protein [Brucella anthropi]KAB2788128.1 DUF2793 domain-containing protein [Brucella anthropi]
MRVHFRHGSIQGLDNMAQNSFALMTNLGRAKEAAALANGTAIVITHIAIGDGTTVPSGGETELYNEIARKSISGHGTVAGASNVAYFDIFLTAAEGPYTIREAGLYDDDGDLIAIARYDPPINKPVPASGQTVEGTVRLEVAFSNIANVTIVVDPAFTVPLQRLSRLPWIPVLSNSVTTPPLSPALGDTYLVPSGATGSWAGQSGKIAEYTAAGWGIITPPNGHGISLPDGRIFEKVSGVYIEKLALDVQSGMWSFANAAGSANALTATLSPAPLSLQVGMAVNLFVGTANTSSAVTLNLNGLGAKSILTRVGDAVGIGDISGSVTLVYDGTSWRLSSVAPSEAAQGQQVFNSSGTFTVPAGVYGVVAQVWGSGAGGGGTGSVNNGSAGGGGAGGYCVKRVSVTPGENIVITVAPGGNAGGGGGAGGHGGTSSFGSFCSATGGIGGQPNTASPDGGAGGGATGGDINIGGGSGASGVGGASSATGGFGGGAPMGGPGGSAGHGASSPGVIPGGGGGGRGTAASGTGGAGANGLVIVSW